MNAAGGTPSALVVGGTRGLGLAVSRSLLARGFAVTTVGRSAPPAGVRTHHDCELNDSATWRSLAARLAAEAPSVDLTLFIAGFARAVAPTSTTPEIREQHYRVNADYVAEACSQLAPRWRAGAAVVTIGSQWTHRVGGPLLVPYIMAKQALFGLTRELAAETLGTVRVRHYCVPTMDTHGFRAVRDSFLAAGFADELECYGLGGPLASTDRVAEAMIAHISSEDSLSLTWRIDAEGACEDIDEPGGPR